MQRVGQDVDVRRTPIHQFAIHPDLAIAIVVTGHHALLICISCVIYGRSGHKVAQNRRLANIPVLESQQG